MARQEINPLNGKTRGEAPIAHEKSKILRGTFAALSGKTPQSIDIDTVKYEGIYDGKGKLRGTKIIPGSGEFLKHEDKINLRWGNEGKSTSFELKQNITKKVNGEAEVNKTAEPTWLQIAKEIGRMGAYPDEIKVETERAFVGKGGVLEKPVLEGEFPFEEGKPYIIEHAKKNNPEYRGRRLNLIEVGRDLITKEVVQKGSTGKVAEKTIFRTR